jgi:putative Holliday junction resolvase
VSEVTGPILAVDPGEKHIGIAISDETAILARPLIMINHTSMKLDAAQIAKIAEENHATRIIVGLPMGHNGTELPQTRHARKLIESVQRQTAILVEGWDEWGSTQAARNVLIEVGAQRSKRGGHQDALAAAMILRSYLDEINPIES